MTKEIFFRTLGQYFGKLSDTIQDLLWEDQNYGFKFAGLNFKNWIHLCSTDQLDWEIEDIANYF